METHNPENCQSEAHRNYWVLATESQRSKGEEHGFKEENHKWCSNCNPNTPVKKVRIY